MCNDEKHVETVDAKVTEKSDGATCTEAGKITYTATVTFEGKDYTGTKTEEVAALGHDYKVSEKDGWKWTADKEKDIQLLQHSYAAVVKILMT